MQKVQTLKITESHARKSLANSHRTIAAETLRMPCGVMEGTAVEGLAVGVVCTSVWGGAPAVVGKVSPTWAGAGTGIFVVVVSVIVVGTAGFAVVVVAFAFVALAVA